ncbi:hypothetical protein L1887_17309 [Cichorium endivia]|nr:hypothetical protein L1887_17309 [Cichorium endivia]
MVKGREGERIRLYTRGTVLGYKSSKSNQYPNTSLVQIEGINTKEEVAWYQGKRMAYIYKAKVKRNGSPATVLEDTVSYIQELQGRMKELEGLSDLKRKNMQDLLVEIYSSKNCTTLVKVLREMQKLGLSVISSSTMPFTDTILLITIVAQKNDDFIMSSTDLVMTSLLVSFQNIHGNHNGTSTSMLFYGLVSRFLSNSSN